MAYKSIVLNLDIDGMVVPVIKLGVDLAQRFEARLIGVSAADVPPPVVMEGGVAFEGESMMHQRKNIERRIEDLRAEFEGLAGATVDSEWRGAVGNPTRLVIETARVADLIVTASPEGASSGNVHRSTDLGNLILQAGRPVFVASTNQENFRINKVLVGRTRVKPGVRLLMPCPFYKWLRRFVSLRSTMTQPTKPGTVWTMLSPSFPFTA
jgi:hypothetical protein